MISVQSNVSATQSCRSQYSKRDGGVYQNCPRSSEILFVAADAIWRTEAARLLDRSADDPDLAQCPEAKGRPHSLLREAYEARERALAFWEASRRAEAAA